MTKRIAYLCFLIVVTWQCSPPVLQDTGSSTLPLREQLIIKPLTPEVILDQSVVIRLEPRDGWYKVQPPIRWSSSEPDIIMVRGAGEEASIQGLRTGSAMITAIDANGAMATARARVR